MILTKNLLKGVFITEKFALLNIIKALEGLSVKHDGNNAEESPPPRPSETRPSGTEKTEDVPNVMAKVIERHERISNRVRSNGARTK